MGRLEVVHTVYGIIGGCVMARAIMPLWWVVWPCLMTSGEGIETERIISWWWCGSM